MSLADYLSTPFLNLWAWFDWFTLTEAQANNSDFICDVDFGPNPFQIQWAN